MKRVTIKHVAKEAKTSPATVSKVLTDGPESNLITAACRARIYEACKKLGYVPQHAARSLRAGKSYAIGGMMGMQLDPYEPKALKEIQFHGPVLAGILTAAHQRGFQFVALAGNDHEKPYDIGLRYLQQQRIDGLIVPGSYDIERSELVQLSQQGWPVVFAGWPIDPSMPVRVQPDETGSISDALELLMHLGHRKIAWLGPIDDHTDSRVIHAFNRRMAFDQLMKEKHCESVCYMPHLEPSVESTPIDAYIQVLTEPVTALLEEISSPPTAMLVYNEFWALALYAACNKCGLRIPEDLSIIAFDDIYAATALPPMTVINLGLFEVGVQALELVADLAEKKQLVDICNPIDKRVATRLVIRNSTGPAPNI